MSDTKLRYLGAVLRFLSENEYTHREDIAILVSEIFENNPDCTLEEFTRSISKIRRDFFRINKINRLEFVENIYSILKRVQSEVPSQVSTKTDGEEPNRLLITKLEQVIQLLAKSLPEEAARRNLESTDIDVFLSDFRIKYAILRKRQDHMIDEQKQMNEILAKLILALNKDESLRTKIVRKLGGFGESVASDTLAGLIVEAISQLLSTV